jgi:hypothetical protein
LTGNLINAASTLTCPHGGRIVTAAGSSAVRSDGQAVRTERDVFAVQGCPHRVAAKPDPCLAVRWSPPGEPVRVDGVAVLTDTTDGQCFGADLLPRGRPLVRTAQGVRCR